MVCFLNLVVLKVWRIFSFLAKLVEIYTKDSVKNLPIFFVANQQKIATKKTPNKSIFLSDSITSSEKTLEQDILSIANYKPINTTTTICGFDVVKHETSFGYLDLISGQGNWVSHLWVSVERWVLSHRENDSTIFSPMK